MIDRMPDLKAQVDAARAAIKQAISAAMVRREQSEEEIKRVRALVTEREVDLDRALAAADASLSSELQTTVEHLHLELTMHEQARTSAEHDIETLKTELAGMDGLERQADRAQVLGAVQRAHDSTSVTGATLDRVRASIGAMEAEASLNRDLAAQARDEREAAAAAADEAARARLAELKARRGARSTVPSVEDAREDSAEGSDTDAPLKKPKRTL